MVEKNKLEVTISGQQYTLTSDRSESEIQDVADFVNAYIHDFQSPANRFNKLSQVTLACLNMGMELMDQKRAIEGFQAEWEALKNNHQEKQKTTQNLQKNLQILEEEIQKLNEIISSKDEQIARLEKEKKELDQEVETLSDHFRTRQKASQKKEEEGKEPAGEQKTTRARKPSSSSRTRTSLKEKPKEEIKKTATEDAAPSK